MGWVGEGQLQQERGTLTKKVTSEQRREEGEGRAANPGSSQRRQGEKGAVPGAWGEGKGQAEGSEGATRDLTRGGSARPVARATRKQVRF